MTPQRLTEWRTARGWSYVEAARQTGTHRNSWPKWEAPDGNPPEWLSYVVAAVSFNLPPYE